MSIHMTMIPPAVRFLSSFFFFSTGTIPRKLHDACPLPMYIRWLSTAVLNGSQRFPTPLNGFHSLSTDINGFHSLSMALNGFQRLSTALKGFQRLSTVRGEISPRQGHLPFFYFKTNPTLSPTKFQFCLQNEGVLKFCWRD